LIMSESKSLSRGRTQPSGAESDSDSDSDNAPVLKPASADESSILVPGGFRGKVAKYETAAQFPSPPLYSEGETVYLIVPGQGEPDGPFVVASIEANNMYRLRRVDNGQEHSQSVTENSLVVPVS